MTVLVGKSCVCNGACEGRDGKEVVGVGKGEGGGDRRDCVVQLAIVEVNDKRGDGSLNGMLNSDGLIRLKDLSGKGG